MAVSASAASMSTAWSLNPVSKGELLRSFLEARGVRLSGSFGWRKVSCFNKAAHPRGDRNPSASVNLKTGRYKCFACDLSGDVFDLIKH